MTRHNKWWLMGTYFGYPQCCISDFCKRRYDRLTKAQKAVHQNLGFIPCPFHAKQIVAGKATLEGLIHNRQCPTPFPNDTAEKPELKMTKERFIEILKEYDYSDNVIKKLFERHGDALLQDDEDTVRAKAKTIKPLSDLNNELLKKLPQ